VLVVLYLLAGILAFSYSSLSIFPEPGSRRLHATVTAGDEPSYVREATGDGVLRLPLRVTAFGRTFRVEADGYLPRTVEVRPLWGATLVAGSDLRSPPSLLFRVMPEAQGSLGGGGSFAVFSGEGEAREALIGPLTEGEAFAAGAAHGASFVAGPRRPIPGELPGRWQLELAARDLPATTTAHTLLAWRQPQAVASRAPLLPGMQLTAEVWTRAQKIKARALFVVGEEAYQDVLVE
jgi:hypothetical protein